MKPNPLHLLWFAAAGVLAGCGHAPNAPVGSSSTTTAAHVAGVPDFSSVEVRYADGLLHVAAIPAGPGGGAPFDPAREGGWCFQLFIDADQGHSGYGTGIDYLLRAIEVLPGGGVEVRRAEGGGGPGGWGESVGRVAVDVCDGVVGCSIPLSILGPDDGAIDFVLETYRTVRLPEEKGGGLSHEFAANYAGSSVPFSRAGGVVRRGRLAIAPNASRVP